MEPKTWFAVRSIFRHERVVEGVASKLFEERVVLFLASDAERALALGAEEARGYATDGAQPKLLAHLVAFELWDAQLQSGDEVWSCLREMDVSDDRFLDQIYGSERLGLRHVE